MTSNLFFFSFLDSNIISFNYENHKVINTEDSEFCQSYHSSIDLKNYNR